MQNPSEMRARSRLFAWVLLWLALASMSGAQTQTSRSRPPPPRKQPRTPPPPPTVVPATSKRRPPPPFKSQVPAGTPPPLATPPPPPAMAPIPPSQVPAGTPPPLATPQPPPAPPAPIPPSPFANPLGPSICPPAGGGAYAVSSEAAGGEPLYPGTPHEITPFVDDYVVPRIATPRWKECRGGADLHCMVSFEIEATEFQSRAFDNALPACKALPGAWMMGYDGQVPGPTIIAPVGHETLVRFNNLLTGTGDRLPASPALCPAAQGKSGRGIAVHHHGGATLAPFDGWAEDVICSGESKDYFYGENRPITGWYHDHAVHLTSVNSYSGLKGFYYSTAKIKEGGCGEPYNLEDVEELPMMLSDVVLDSQCQLFSDFTGVHQDDLYGDINTVNGVPFPRIRAEAKWYRLRLLNASPSRPYLLKIKDQNGVDVSATSCQIIAKDGGFRTSPVAFPAAGLVIAPAERYEAVCNFIGHSGKTLWLWNEKDPQFKEEVPYFCYSHLIAKIEVGAALSNPAPAFNPALRPAAGTIPANVVLTPTDVATAQAMANAGRFHRSFDFGRNGGQWTINGLTWESARISAADVGQNTWEVWKFNTGGGWFHPVHVHLVDMFILRRVGDVGDGVTAYEQNSPADVVFLGPGQDIYVLMRFGPHRGDYMFHCHNLVHEDDDMMVDFRIVSAAQGRADNRATADRFVRNPLYGIVYDNFNYADPMYADTRAKPTASMPDLRTAMQSSLTANLYRILFPTAADQTAYAGFENPWKVQVCAF